MATPEHERSQLASPGHPASTVWLLTIAHVAVGAGLVLSDYSLNNEGLLTYYWASWARQEPIPVFFFQKIKPTLAAFYAPFSVLDARPFMILHVCVAAAAIPMIAAIARSIGQPFSAIPAAVVALSPVHLFGGAAGVSNTDGLTGIVASLYFLCARKNPFAAGLIAGALPWVRFEIATFAAMLGLFALITPGQRRAVLGLTIFPIAYVATGALYHGDLLWVFHYPASAPFDPGNPIYAHQRVGLRYFLEPLTVLTPLAALVASVSLRRLQPIERAVLAYLVVTISLMTAMQVLRVGNFGDAPRYVLHLLPAIALLLGRAWQRWADNDRPVRMQCLLTLCLVAWMATRQSNPVTAAVLATVPFFILIASWIGRGAAARTAAALLLLCGPLLPLRSTLNRPEIARYLAPMTSWLLAHRDDLSDSIYTNSQLLHSYAADSLAPAHVYFLAGIDTAREIVDLTNPHNGQRQTIQRLFARDLYGRSLLPPFDPGQFPDGSILALRKDARLPQILEAETWAPFLEPLTDHADFRIARLRNAEPTDQQRERAHAILRAAIAAHGGREALARFAQFHIASRGVFKGEMAFERQVDFIDHDNWSSSIRFAPATMRMGFDRGRCWVEERNVFETCDETEAREIPLMGVRHNAWILTELEGKQMLPASDIEGNPALRAGPALLVFDRTTNRLIEIRHGSRSERLSAYRNISGTWIASKRTLYIDGMLDLEEEWVDIHPGIGQTDVMRPPPEPDEGVVRVFEHPKRVVAWTEVVGPTDDLRRVVNALDSFVKQNGRKISWADGILWLAPQQEGERWRLAIGVEADRAIKAMEAGGFHLDNWPAQRSLTLFHRGDFASAVALRGDLERALQERDLAPRQPRTFEILAPRTIFSDPPDWGLVQLRTAIE